MDYKKAIENIEPECICPDTSKMAKAVSEYNARTRCLRDLFAHTGIKCKYELPTLPYVFESCIAELLSVRPNIYPDDTNNDAAALQKLKTVISNYDKFYVFVLKELSRIRNKFLPEIVMALDVFSYEVNNFVIKGSLPICVANDIRKVRSYCGSLKKSCGEQFKSCWDGDMSKIQAFEIARYMERNDICIDVMTLSRMVVKFSELKEKLQKQQIHAKKEKSYKKSRHTEKMQIQDLVETKYELFKMEQELIQNASQDFQKIIGE